MRTTTEVRDSNGAFLFWYDLPLGYKMVPAEDDHLPKDRPMLRVCLDRSVNAYLYRLAPEE